MHLLSGNAYKVQELFLNIQFTRWTIYKLWQSLNMLHGYNYESMEYTVLNMWEEFPHFMCIHLPDSECKIMTSFFNYESVQYAMCIHNLTRKPIKLIEKLCSKSSCTSVQRKMNSHAITIIIMTSTLYYVDDSIANVKSLFSILLCKKWRNCSHNFLINLLVF